MRSRCSSCHNRSSRVERFFPDVIAMAEKGVMRALRDDPHFLDGLNVYKGMLTEKPVAEAQGREYVPVGDAIGSA